MNRTPQRFILPYEPGYTAHRAEDARRLKIASGLSAKAASRSRTRRRRKRTRSA